MKKHGTAALVIGRIYSVQGVFYVKQNNKYSTQKFQYIQRIVSHE